MACPRVSSSKLMLPLLTCIYVIGELGHFLIGVVSRDIAQDVGYGDKSCLAIPDVINSDAGFCQGFKNADACIASRMEDGNDSSVQTCEWNFNGLGTEYQILAGPAFVLCFTVAGVMWGVVADRINRVHLLGFATIAFSLALSGTAFATKYWHLVLFRVGLAAGEAAAAPLAASMIGDVFPQDKRALAMGVFNWGIYLGFGLSFAVGTYINDTSVFDEKWRTAFLISGIPGILIGVLFLLLVREPRNAKKNKIVTPPTLGSESNLDKRNSESTTTSIATEDSREEFVSNSKKLNENPLLALVKRPEIVILGIAACIRHSAGFSWGYNSALYFQHYYPGYDVAWWLTGISIGGGALGSVAGGYISDRLVTRLGISARALVLAASQIIAVPFTFGLLYLDPPYAFLSLFIGFFLSEMWFGVMYAILVELVPANFRSTAIGVALFVINNVGGNLPIVVDPLAAATDYRTSLAIMYGGAILTSSVGFLICWILLRRRK